MSAPPTRPDRPMDGLTRRSLLLGSGVLGAAAVIAGATRVDLGQVLARAASDRLPTGSPILVVVTLYGGNDWLNTVVPHGDSAYYAARPGLAHAAGSVLPIDDGLGLAPTLTGLASEYAAGRLAVVRGVGYPKPDRSHFRSMDIWQTGSPESPTSSGWLGRWLDGAGTDPLLAIGIGSVLPPLLVGATTAAAALDSGRTPRAAKRVQDLDRVAAGLAVADPADSEAARAAAASYAAYRLVQGVSGPAPATAPPTTTRAGQLTRQLELVARCITAGAPTRVYAASLGGFDTHADELGRQGALLAELDAGLAALRAGLAGTARESDVVTLVYSEFGRRVAANGSDGTDHGTAGNVLLLGHPVRGGVHGEQPSLTALDAGDLRMTTDFRSVYAALLDRVLGTDPARVLGDRCPAPLDVLR